MKKSYPAPGQRNTSLGKSRNVLEEQRIFLGVQAFSHGRQAPPWGQPAPASGSLIPFPVEHEHLVGTTKNLPKALNNTLSAVQQLPGAHNLLSAGPRQLRRFQVTPEESSTFLESPRIFPGHTSTSLGHISISLGQKKSLPGAHKPLPS